MQIDIDALVGRARGLLAAPTQEWPRVRAEDATAGSMYRNYLLWMAAMPAVAGFIKGTILGYSVPFGDTYRVGFFAGLLSMLVGYALSLAIIYLLAQAVSALASHFGATPSPQRALQLVGYAYTPSFVAGVALLIPGAGSLILLAGGCYSIYLFYLGAPTLMGCPEDKALGFTATAVLAAIVIGWMASAIAAVMLGGGPMAGYAGGF